MSQCILIVDDDPVQRRILEEQLSRLDHVVRTAEDGEEAIAALSGPGGSDISLVVLDLVMPDLDGMGVLARMAKDQIRVPVIVQTAHGGIDTVVSAMRAGAVDFVVKPVSAERLAVSVANALKVNALEGEISRIRRRVEGTFTFADIVTRSPEMARVIHLGERAAASNIPIMIEGESGVGKEIIARAIQGSGPRRGKPFVTVNCGAIPANLVESVLFGHEKGAFTGATERHAGKFVEANGGTLFLDEVSELPLDAQVKLLRAVQEGEVDPVGGKKPVKVDLRIISATNRNMLELVREGKFREDLFYRLNVFPILVPPLRARREDVPELVKLFVTRCAAEEGKRIDGIDPEALAKLQRYDWPGNVRQLENAVFRAVVLADGPRLTMREFPQIAIQIGELPGAEIDAPPPRGADAEPVAPDHGRPFAAPPLAADAGQLIADAVRALDDDGQVRSLEDIEADIIRFALSHYDGHMSEVARRLKIGRSTLYRKLRDIGIEQPA
ncbi:MAG: sigma-54-dependent Fis family transcriptional regulator [Rhodobiaceae bacterium]|nr:sigma-54-dependent Fis family transcriptional regulator [Rhodobiaceae bacterium]